MKRQTLVRTVVAACALVLATTGWAAARCAGDCDGDAGVSVDELTYLVNVSLQSASSQGCGAGDVNQDGLITVDELVVAVAGALRGCRTETATPSPTRTSSPAPQPTLPPDSELYREFDRVSSGACERNRIQVRETLLSFGCSSGRGHEASLAIEVFSDRELARAAFEDLAMVGRPVEFEEFPAAAWEEGAEVPPFVPRHHLVWLAECAVVNVRSFNETIYGTTPDARELATAMVSWIRGFVVRRCPP